jgi:hypothetical protein
VTRKRVSDFLLGGLTAFPTTNSRFFIRLEQFVGLEKVAHFIKHVLGQVFNVDVIFEARVM